MTSNDHYDEGFGCEIQDLIVIVICIVMAAILLTYNLINLNKK